MNDLRESLDAILFLCQQSRTYTRRTQQIHEIAMRGLGMTANQRESRHMAITQRVGTDAQKERFLQRVAERKEKISMQVQP